MDIGYSKGQREYGVNFTSMTAKGFFVDAGWLSSMMENKYLAEEDRRILENICKRMEEQRRDLDFKTQTMIQLQKQNETLTVAAKTDKNENIDLKKQISKMKDENNLLSHHNNNVAAERFTNLFSLPFIFKCL